MSESPTNAQKWSTVSFWGAIIILLGLTGFQVSSHLYLYGDGSHFLLSILSDKEFFQPVDSRFFANILKQFLPVLLIKSGITDIKWISIAFGLNQYLVPMVGVILSYFILPKKDKAWIVFALASYLLNLHHNNLYISTESFASAAIFWPLLYYIVFGTHSRKKIIWASIGIILTSTMHEASLFLQLVFAVALAFKGKDLFSHNLWILISLSLAVIISLSINYYWILHPQDYMIVQHKEDFISGIIQLKTFLYVRLSLPLAALLIAQTFFKFTGKLRITLFVAIGVFIALIIEQTLKGDQMFYPILHWEHRGLIILTPAFLGLALILFWKFRYQSETEFALPRYSLILATLVFTIYQVRITTLWNDFTSDLTSQISSSRGILDYDKTSIASNQVKDQFAYTWSVPSLGLALHCQNSDEVNALWRVPDSIWQPWRPSNRGDWPNLSYYGVEYRLFGPNKYLD